MVTMVLLLKKRLMLIPTLAAGFTTDAQEGLATDAHVAGMAG